MAKPRSHLGTVAVAGMLIAGTGTTVLMKLMLQQKADGWYGKNHKYDKPFMQSFLMFLGMAASYLLNKCWDPQKKGQSRLRSSFRQKVMVSIPASFDNVASTLMTFGLIYVNVSIMQMLRGSMTIFSTILRWLFLGRKPKPYQWVAIGIAIVAMVLIATAGIMLPNSNDEESHTKKEKVIGSILILASQLVQAAQIVVEEVLLTDLTMAALDIVGWEGIWGILEVVFMCFPLALIITWGHDPGPFGDCLENFMDSFIQTFTNGKCLACALGFVVVVLALNISGMLVTATSEATNRTLMEAARTVGIWITMLICGAATKGSATPFGEPWTRYSWMELGGFGLLFAALALYNGLVQLPIFDYASPALEQIDHEPLMGPDEKIQ